MCLIVIQALLQLATRACYSHVSNGSQLLHLLGPLGTIVDTIHALFRKGHAIWTRQSHAASVACLLHIHMHNDKQVRELVY